MDSLRPGQYPVTIRMVGYAPLCARVTHCEERGLALMPISKDANNGTYDQHKLVRIYIIGGLAGKGLSSATA